MRKLIAAEYLSLDAGMEDPGPTGDFEHRGWTMPYWNAMLLKGDIAEEVRKLKQQSGQSIVIYGSSELVRKGRRFFRDGGNGVRSVAPTTSRGGYLADAAITFPAGVGAASASSRRTRGITSRP
jgi:hypothetical protein